MNYGKEELLEILTRIDEEASLLLGIPDGDRHEVVIVGGSAFLLNDLTNRPTTHDVDVLACDKDLRGILAQYHAFNAAVAAYMDQIPYNFEDRLTPIGLPTKTVAFLTPSIEDLAVMKLYGWRPNDQQDLESELFLNRVNWKTLDTLVYDPGEAKASALSPRRYAEMRAVYEDYARKHGHEPDVQGIS